MVIDAHGREQARLRRSLPPPERDGDRVSQEPEIWWQTLLDLLRDLFREMDPSLVASLAIDGTSASLLLCDATGNPCGPALLYSDSHCRSESARIAAMAPAESGAHGPSASLAKLLCLQRQHPGARHALHQAEWLAARLCGHYDRGDENNALKLGFDPLQQSWPDWLSKLGIRRALLPRPAPPGTVQGLVTHPEVLRLGLRADVAVVAGTTDSTAAVLATGVREPGEAVTSLGSTLVLKVLSPEPVFAPEMGVYSHHLNGRWLAGGASNSGGAVLLQHFSPEQLTELSRALVPEKPTGLDYYPLPAPGERFPFPDPDRPPRLTPHPDSDTRFLQGLLEGIAAIEAQGYRRLAELGAPYPTSVRSVGGGANNPAWSIIRARLLVVPLITPEHSEAAYGAALLARRALFHHKVREGPQEEGI